MSPGPEVGMAQIATTNTIHKNGIGIIYNTGTYHVIQPDINVLVDGKFFEIFGFEAGGVNQ